MTNAQSQPRVGVLLPTRELAMTGEFSAAPLLDFAQQAEELGFDSLWTGDSLLARPRLDPLVVLAAVAAATSRVTIGTAAITAVLRPPLIGANMVASLDQVARGRLTLGVGAGFPVPQTEEEFEQLGIPFTGRAGRLDDTVALWRAAWASRAGGEPDFTGRHAVGRGLDRLPPPATPQGPPIWLASSDTPRVLARVAERYDGWMPFLPTPEAYAAGWQRIGELAAERGRPEGAITGAFYATINVNPDRQRAEEELEEYVQHYYGRPLGFMAQIQAYGNGTAEECAQWLAGYVRAGARHLVIRIGSLQPATQLKEIAEVLVPALRRLA
ncbi:LLM class flavin-dependent oxidoreductase [Micromonospora siamensis]|uniref:Flavin-dependent oxidoreductase, luciferase family (Includes alkanesulfonate monooxygenase SsuD and methylene tetrahydromethanopterin reductase) n=1 Tax=Micromonospora siamensis TaxID=299152 RepID=A0A1C5HUM5_9ACTN|nr:LLM class flavin-dependent oxidoreductase [Micromonospora siamensis]SCG49745.1 Flavin-dependent oxidoreductase, luciferase family (includes alkanesulfonate monooxygenase SsuD and methylene tetrahydromethanopterin reductase) [Micromonospora siamensis]